MKYIFAAATFVGVGFAGVLSCSPAEAQSRATECYDCDSSDSSRPSSGVDPTFGALLEIQKIHGENTARRDTLDADREWEREERRKRWEREFDAQQALLRQEWAAFTQESAASREQYQATVEQLRTKHEARLQRPMFLSKDSYLDVMLGYGTPADRSSGLSFMKDQNGNDVGTFHLSSKISSDGQYLNVEISITNTTNCKMHFNGFFKKGDRPYDLLSWGNGAEVDYQGRRTITDRIVVGGGGEEKDFHRFTPDVAFTDCAGEG